MGNALNQFYSHLKDFFYSNCNTCRLVDIDAETQEVVFQIKMKSPIFRCSLAEAIFNSSLISTLTPQEACWLGGHYGRYLKSSDESQKMRGQINDPRILLKNSKGNYRVVYLDRSGKISYSDKKSGKTYNEHPLAIATNEHIISMFDPSQACYIGILAGISIEKAALSNNNAGQKDLAATLNKLPALRIVK